MDCITIRLKTITPIFMGGAYAEKNDGIRASEIKGFRALYFDNNQLNQKYMLGIESLSVFYLVKNFKKKYVIILEEGCYGN